MAKFDAALLEELRPTLVEVGEICSRRVSVGRYTPTFGGVSFVVRYGLAAESVSTRTSGRDQDEWVEDLKKQIWEHAHKHIRTLME